MKAKWHIIFISLWKFTTGLAVQSHDITDNIYKLLSDEKYNDTLDVVAFRFNVIKPYGSL